MRVLFWNSLYLPHIGGLEIFTARLAAGLIARGHEAAVVAAQVPRAAPEEEILDGVRVFRLPFHEAVSHPEPITRIRLLKSATTRAAEIKREIAPDLVHLNLADANPLFHLRTLEAHRAPTVVTFQSALLQPATGAQNVTASIVELANRVVAVSDFAARNIAAFTRAPRQAVDVIYPGVPPGEFAPAAGPAVGPPTVVFLGRLKAEKGAEVAVEALAKLPPPVRLLLIGDGPARRSVEARAAALGLGDRVIFAGHVDDAERKRLLATGIALVAPSLHQELFGMIAVEGALSALPVVASDIGGLAEIVVPGQTGALFPPGDAEALAAALAPLVGDPRLARRMGEAGRRRALQRFTLDKTVDAYEQLYKDCLADPAHRVLTPVLA